ncbi:MAG: hypothetical protein ACQESC_04910, partial [Nanobdellota archaeon]
MLIDKAKRAVAKSFTPDVTVIHLLSVIDDLTIEANTLSKRLREWHGTVLPEVGYAIQDNEEFVNTVADMPYEALRKQYCAGVSMAVDKQDASYDTIKDFAGHVRGIFMFKQSLLAVLKAELSRIAPNIAELCGPTIGARLLSSAGSLKKMAFMPSSTIQLLGAEKALFRHLRSGSNSPKHGFIFSHPLIQQAKQSLRGKVARVLADKISFCSRLDYFKGEFKADEYYKQLKGQFQGEKA